LKKNSYLAVFILGRRRMASCTEICDLSIEEFCPLFFIMEKRGINKFDSIAFSVWNMHVNCKVDPRQVQHLMNGYVMIYVRQTIGKFMIIPIFFCYHYYHHHYYFLGVMIFRLIYLVPYYSQNR